MNGQEWKDKKLEVTVHEKREQRGNQQPKYTNLYIKNLPQGTDEQELQKMFQDFGEIESVCVQKDETGQLKDSAFVSFKNPDDAGKAQEAMNKKPLADGSFLMVQRHISKKENELVAGSKLHPISQNLSKTFNSNVYVKFIPVDVTEDELREKFSAAGKIISIKMDKKYYIDELQNKIP